MISAQIAIFNIIIICPSVSDGGCVSELSLHRVQDSFPLILWFWLQPCSPQVGHKPFYCLGCAGLVLASSAASVLLLLASLCTVQAVSSAGRNQTSA